MKKEIQIGDRFGKLTVIAYAGRIKKSKKENRKHWICKCDCGQEKICNDTLLKKGSILSCGCIKISTNKRRKLNINNFIDWCNENIYDNNIHSIWDYDNNKIIPENINCSDLEQTIHLLCPIHGKYSKKLKRFFDDYRCPNCMKFDRNNSLALCFPKVLNIWSDKNKFSPYDISKDSSTKIWLKCSQNKHNDYLQYIRNTIRSDCDCPKCVEERSVSKAELFVTQYLENMGYNVLHEYNCNIVAINPKTGRKMPYDNEISDLKLIIEVNGLQHYQVKSTYNIWNSKVGNISPEESLRRQQYRDEIKKQFAINNGYSYMAIPYWRIYDDSFKKLIDEKILDIKQGNL